MHRSDRMATFSEADFDRPRSISAPGNGRVAGPCRHSLHLRQWPFADVRSGARHLLDELDEPLPNRPAISLAHEALNVHLNPLASGTAQKRNEPDPLLPRHFQHSKHRCPRNNPGRIRQECIEVFYAPNAVQFGH